MNGILCVYKERGYTSHDVINKLRRICKQKKIGHTGTLDPNAEGVLPVCFGNATKVCGILTDTDKTYRAELILGKITDTYDITGEVISENQVNVTEQQFREAVDSFVGKQLQTPPMFSARKVNGQKLYDLARQGISVEREAKEITVHSMKIEEINLNNGTVVSAVLEVECSKGTYIRSICHDLGNKLGCGACMGALLRTKVGRFLLSDCYKLEEIEGMMRKEVLESTLISADSMFPYRRLWLTEGEADFLLKNGNCIPVKLLMMFFENHPVQNERFYCMYEASGRFAAIYEYIPGKKMLKPFTMFPNV